MSDHASVARPRLSPLNFSALLTRLRRMPDDGAEEDRAARVEEVVMYRCMDCDELHNDEFDAEECCRQKTSDRTRSEACPVCGQVTADHRDAADCCLWKDLDAATRWRIADAVSAGSTWAAELGVARDQPLLPNNITLAESPTHA